MKFSIITPTLNSIEFLKKSSDSVLINQKYPNIEWIIIDGGSTDGTIEYLNSLENTNIKIFNDDSGHPSKAFNYGITKANGEIISLLGSDDYYEEEIFSEIAFIFENNKIDWLIGYNEIVDKHEKEIRKIITKFKKSSLNNYSFKKLSKNNFIAAHSVFWKKEFMPNKIGNFNTNEFIESMDYEMWLRMGRISKPYILKKKLSNFRMHKNSLTTKGNLKQLNQMYLVSLKYGKFNVIEKIILKTKSLIIFIIYKLLMNFN